MPRTLKINPDGPCGPTKEKSSSPSLRRFPLHCDIKKIVRILVSVFDLLLGTFFWGGYNCTSFLALPLLPRASGVPKYFGQSNLGPTCVDLIFNAPNVANLGCVFEVLMALLHSAKI